jgi:long-chain acyl-CoA synthetase
MVSLTLPAVLEASARAHAGRPALSMVNGEPLTYKALLTRVQTVASLLDGRGVRRGDRVAILSENMTQWGIAYFAVTGMGAVAVPIMTEFQPAQIENIIDHAGCRAVIVSARLRDKVARVAGAGPAIDIEEFSSLPEAPFELPAVAEEDLAAIIYTSGTTGHSKGVMLTHRNIVFDALATHPLVHVRRTDRLLSILTLAHAYECTLGLVAALSCGAAVYYLDKPPSATALIPALQRVRPTIVLSVPLVIEKIYRTKVQPELEKIRLYRIPVFRRLLTLLAGRKLRKTFGGRLRAMPIGGAALAPDVERFLRAARFPYAVGYGLTETAPVIAGAPPFRTRPGGTGRAMPGVQVRIADPRPDTGEGEIQVRGPNVMSGYYRDDARTREVFTEDGWLRTGDLGTLDSKGRLSIRGRLKNMILGASGENIYPEEIEAVINQSAYVEDSLVYGEGASVIALVQLKPDLPAPTPAASDGPGKTPFAVLLERIKEEVNTRLPGFSSLHRMELQSEPFERTPSQKIKRFLYPRRPGR